MCDFYVYITSIFSETLQLTSFSGETTFSNYLRMLFTFFNIIILFSKNKHMSALETKNIVLSIPEIGARSVASFNPQLETVQYEPLGRETPAYLKNKDLTDASNSVAATLLRSDTGGNVAIIGGAPATGQVLTAAGTATASWQSPAQIPDVVRIPITGIVATPAAGVYTFTFGTPINRVGNSASSVVVSAHPTAGSRLTTIAGRSIYSAEATLCLQYSSQGAGTFRTFMNLNINNVTDVSCADGVPANTNNWRADRSMTTYGISAGQFFTVNIDTNTTGVPTLNSGFMFLQIMG
jgi:hypothetical protein